MVVPTLAAVTTAAVAVTLPRSDPQAPPPAAGGTYSVRGLRDDSCLEIADASRSNGAAVRQAGCVDGVARQEFRLRPVDGDAYTLVNVNSGLCLDVPGASKAVGVALQQWTCGGESNAGQRFAIVASSSGHQLQSIHSGLCLAAADGPAVAQVGCGGSEATAQQWKLGLVDVTSSVPGGGGTYSLLGVGSGLCLEAPDDGLTGGTVIHQSGCGGAAATAQQFALVSIGSAYQLRNIKSGLCLEVKDGRKVGGAVVLQSTCGASTATSQQFLLTKAGPGYQLQNVNSGLCVEIESGSTAVGATTRQWECDGTGAKGQQWKLVSAPASGVPVTSTDSSGGNTIITVADDGTGSVTSVQAAVDLVPPNENRPYLILIRKGTYSGQVTIPTSKPRITLMGATGDAGDVVLTAAKPVATAGTQGSATVYVAAADTTVKNLTIINAYDEAASGRSQALALYAAGDRQVYENIRVIGDQNTLLTHSGNQNRQFRQYFYRSYVEGDVDFIYGDSAVVFDGCTIFSSSRGIEGSSGYITAPSTPDVSRYGFLFVNSTLTGDAPTGSVYLGRPWHPGDNANLDGQVLVRNSVLGAQIRAGQPWTDMGSFSWKTEARFHEYRNVGVGAETNGNRPQMSDAEVADYTAARYLAGADGWKPLA